MLSRYDFARKQQIIPGVFADRLNGN
ncbi:protein of unknown function [Methylocaldum szegediense]|uniref:Transposase n=1 Tax=Methylocaldum szegediense TaxID=73780 RepID=A0ABN8XAA2_9GAMM|nr:protein of unknown function [Methylocaldum szegediense]